MLNLTGKIVRSEGNVYRLTSAVVGTRLLLSAECVFGREKGNVIYNLNKNRSKRANIIRNAVKLGLVS